MCCLTTRFCNRPSVTIYQVDRILNLATISRNSDYYLMKANWNALKYVLHCEWLGLCLMFIQSIEHIFGGGTKTSSMLSLALFLCISCWGMHKSFAASAIKVRKQISGFSAHFSDTIYEGYYLPHIMVCLRIFFF